MAEVVLLRNGRWWCVVCKKRMGWGPIPVDVQPMCCGKPMVRTGGDERFGDE